LRSSAAFASVGRAESESFVREGGIRRSFHHPWVFAVHPDPAPGSHATVSYVPYVFVAPAVDGRRQLLRQAGGRVVMLRCSVPVSGPRRCVIVADAAWPT
jgi:hypothetical protein